MAFVSYFVIFMSFLWWFQWRWAVFFCLCDGWSMLFLPVTIQRKLYHPKMWEDSWSWPRHRKFLASRGKNWCSCNVSGMSFRVEWALIGCLLAFSYNDRHADMMTSEEQHINFNFRKTQNFARCCFFFYLSLVQLLVYNTTKENKKSVAFNLKS